jgi:hypothetical protein
MKSIFGAGQGGTTVFKNQTRFNLALYCLIGMFVIGDLDYMTGYRTSVIAVYVLPIGFAAVDVGTGFAIVLAILSMAISIASDLWAGLPSSDLPTKILNTGIALTVFIVSIVLLQELKRVLQRRE